MHTDTPAAGAADPLLPEALAWIEQLRRGGVETLLYPVSRLQREFRTGYSRACALVDALAERGEWTIAFDDSGTRHALVHRQGAAWTGVAPAATTQGDEVEFPGSN